MRSKVTISVSSLEISFIFLLQVHFARTPESDEFSSLLSTLRSCVSVYCLQLTVPVKCCLQVGAEPRSQQAMEGRNAADDGTETVQSRCDTAVFPPTHPVANGTKPRSPCRLVVTNVYGVSCIDVN